MNLPHLLRLEWLKLRNYAAFRVVSILYVLAIFLVPLIPYNIFSSIGKGEGQSPLPFTAESFVSFPQIWEWNGYFGGWINFLFLGFLGVLMITNEIQNKTLRQNVITGISRRQFFFSKVGFALALSLIATLLYTLACLLIGSIYSDSLYLSVIFKNWDYLPRFFLMSFSYLSFGLLVGMMIRRTGIAIFFYLIYIMALEPAIRWIGHRNIVMNKSMHFYPMNATEDLTPLPFSKMAENFTEENQFSFFLSSTEAIICVIVYVALFLFLFRWLMLRRDL